MADNEITVVKVGDVILPRARNDGAQIALKRMDNIIAQLPSTVEASAWAAAAIAEANSVDASKESIATCVFNLAFLGLMPGKTLGHAHFIPFKGHAQLVVGYRGWLHLAYSTGFLQTVHTDVICQGEHFENWIDENGPHMKHVPQFDRVADRKSIIGAYCIYKTRDGGSGLRIINRSDIAKSDKKRDVWNSDFESQVRKTVILRTSKTWNNTSRVARAIQLDEQYERDELQECPLLTDDDPDVKPGYILPTGDE